MKKIIISLLVLLVASSNLSAQIARRGLDPESKKIDKTTIWGFVVGATKPTFEYSDQHLSSLPSKFIVRPDLGVFVEFPCSNAFSISPELMFTFKGFKTSYKYGKLLDGTQYDVTYQLDALYASLRVPFIFRITIAGNTNVQPFIFVSPDVSYLIGGKIKLDQPGLPISQAHINIGKANMSYLDASVFLGIGLRTKFKVSSNHAMMLRFDIGYNYGFLNTFSKMELEETAEPTNIHAYNLKGYRMNRAFEFNIHIGMPMKIKKIGCDETNSIYFDNPESDKHVYKKGKNLDKTFRRK